MSYPKCITKLEQIPGLTKEERKKLEPVVEFFSFQTNEYYESLIDWSNPKDPIRRIVIPDIKELEKWGKMDPSNEKRYTVLPGLEHKYDSVAVLLLSDACDSYCRFCFRKRLFIDDKRREVKKDVSSALEYISKHPEIDNVLLTGGDPLVMSTVELEDVIKRIREIDHVQIIRIGTKILAYNPYRILNDPSLLDMIKRYKTRTKKIYIISHFTHPRELEPEEAQKAVNLVQEAGAEVANQTTLLRGISDDPVTLGSLFNKLSYIGIDPYYVFQCRPTIGNKPYAVPIEEAYDIFEKARTLGSGLAKRARFVMSHASGKIEICGKTEEHIYFKYHRTAFAKDDGRFMVYKRNPKATWFDDYKDKDLVAEYKAAA
jgi:KamA family protein